MTRTHMGYNRNNQPKRYKGFNQDIDSPVDYIVLVKFAWKTTPYALDGTNGLEANASLNSLKEYLIENSTNAWTIVGPFLKLNWN